MENYLFSRTAVYNTHSLFSYFLTDRDFYNRLQWLFYSITQRNIKFNSVLKVYTYFLEYLKKHTKIKWVNKN